MEYSRVISLMKFMASDLSTVLTNLYQINRRGDIVKGGICLSTPFHDVFNFIIIKIANTILRR